MKRIELRRKLRKMGIPVKAGMVKKSDIKKVLAEKWLVEPAKFKEANESFDVAYQKIRAIVEKLDDSSVNSLWKDFEGCSQKLLEKLGEGEY